MNINYTEGTMATPLVDADYHLTEGAAWLDVKGYSIRVTQIEDGVVIRVFDRGLLGAGLPSKAQMATLLVQDKDLARNKPRNQT